MKAFFLIYILFFSHFSFAIQKNPQIKSCQTLGGFFLLVNSQNNQLALCKFDKTFVGALDQMLFNQNEVITQSLNYFMKGQRNCESVGGKIQNLAISQNLNLPFCVFSDGSLIDLVSFNKGHDSVDNQKLTEALGL